jgi:hypothetical protein
MSSLRKKYAYLVIAYLIRMITVLDCPYNPNSSIAIEATSLQSPFDIHPPNLIISYINRINITWADSKSILLLSMECGYQTPPFELTNQQMHSVGHEIAREMRLASFYETNQRYLRCKRRRNTIKWEYNISIDTYSF